MPADGIPAWRGRYLTFDDGPAEDTEALLDVLGHHGARATFFLTGERLASHPDLLRRTVQDGHVLGNHSWDHPDLRRLSLPEVRTQLARTSDAIEQITGARPQVFRPPFGFITGPIGALARLLGMRTLLWDVETYDWRDPGATAISEAILSSPRGAVVLLHDGPASRAQTVSGVSQALARQQCSAAWSVYTDGLDARQPAPDQRSDHSP